MPNPQMNIKIHYPLQRALIVIENRALVSLFLQFVDRFFTCFHLQQNNYNDQYDMTSEIYQVQGP